MPLRFFKTFLRSPIFRCLFPITGGILSLSIFFIQAHGYGTMHHRRHIMFGSTLGNLLGTLYFLYFQVVGILVMSKILKKESPLAKALLGSVTGSVLLQWYRCFLHFCLTLLSFPICWHWWQAYHFYFGACEGISLIRPLCIH